MKISVIIPVYNETKTIVGCLASLLQQTESIEIIVVDDGSTDKSNRIIKDFINKYSQIKFITTKHLGPAAARNKGAQNAWGDILVFIDADMLFDKNFIKDLISPIRKKQTNGTFTKEEYVANWNNKWAKCWNYNLNIRNNRRIDLNYPDQAPVFRAILKKEFKRVNGFTINIGWTDDWSLSRKLGYKATMTRAICFHNNPDNLKEIFMQAKWIGKNEFISGNIWRSMINIFRYSLVFSIVIGLIKSFKFLSPQFLLFKVIYDFGITIGIITATLTNQRNK